jgi:hypothetical protein
MKQNILWYFLLLATVLCVLYLLNDHIEGFSGSLNISDLYDVNPSNDQTNQSTDTEFRSTDTDFPWDNYSLNKNSPNYTNAPGTDLMINKPKRTKGVMDSSANLWTRKDSLAAKYPTMAKVDSSKYDYNSLYGIPK